MARLRLTNRRLDDRNCVTSASRASAGRRAAHCMTAGIGLCCWPLLGATYHRGAHLHAFDTMLSAPAVATDAGTDVPTWPFVVGTVAAVAIISCVEPFGAGANNQPDGPEGAAPCRMMGPSVCDLVSDDQCCQRAATCTNPQDRPDGGRATHRRRQLRSCRPEGPPSTSKKTPAKAPAKHRQSSVRATKTCRAISSGAGIRNNSRKRGRRWRSTAAGKVDGGARDALARSVDAARRVTRPCR